MRSRPADTFGVAPSSLRARSQVPLSAPSDEWNPCWSRDLEPARGALTRVQGRSDPVRPGPDHDFSFSASLKGGRRSPGRRSADRCVARKLPAGDRADVCVGSAGRCEVVRKERHRRRRER
jgi:hypothetical protein